jgi:hypothetical protein
VADSPLLPLLPLLRPALFLIAVAAAQTGCEAIFPVDRFMDGPDDSSAAAPALDAGTANAPPPEMPVGVDASLDDSIGDASLDSEPTTDASTEDSSPVSPAAGDGAPSQVAYRGASSARSTAGTLSIATPAAAVVGDLLWVTIYTDHQTTTVTTPSGWTREGVMTSTAADFRTWWLYRFVVANEAASTTFTIANPSSSSGFTFLNVAGLVAYGGVDHTSPFQGVAAAMVTGTPFNSLSVTANTGAVVLTSFVDDSGDGATWTPSPPLVGLVVKGAVFLGDTLAGDAGLSGITTAKSTDGAGMVSVVSLNPAGTQSTFHPGTIGDMVTAGF